jgi:hypothetical protein
VSSSGVDRQIALAAVVVRGFRKGPLIKPDLFYLYTLTHVGVVVTTPQEQKKTAVYKKKKTA